MGKSGQIILFFAFLIKNLNLGIAFLPIFCCNVFKNQSTEGFYMKKSDFYFRSRASADCSLYFHPERYD